MGRELTQAADSHGLTEEDIVHIPGLHSRWVRLASGARAHYMTSGETGPAVILLHGGIAGSSGTAGWRFMAPFLGQNGFRVYCPDQPAFGWADTRPEYYALRGYESYVEFIDQFADAIGVDKFHLSGNSMGADHTAQYVQNHPSRVLSYILIATRALTDLNSDQPFVERMDGKFTPDPNYTSQGWNGTEEGMRDLMAGIIYAAAAVWPELVTMRTKAGLRQKESMDARNRALAELNKDPNYLQFISVRHRLPSLTIPALYLYGLNDILSPVENAFLQEDRLPNIQVFYPNECGHQGQTDQPDMFNQVFLEFFRDGKLSWRTAEWANVSRRRPINSRVVQEPNGGFPSAAPDWLTKFQTVGSS